MLKTSENVEKSADEREELAFDMRAVLMHGDLSDGTVSVPRATLAVWARRVEECEWGDGVIRAPRDANNETIHLGDKTYDCNGNKQAAISFQLYGEENPTWMVNCPDGHVAPYNLTHKRPDSWESIADELDEWCDGADADTTTFDVPRDLADRIRKLAKKEDK